MVNGKSRFAVLPVVAGMLLLAGSAQATTLEGFESGNFGGWAFTGSAWTVGGETFTTPDILPAEGHYFARSGAPNIQSGVLSEQGTGTVTSVAFTVTDEILSWQAAGWSGPTDNGHNYFQIFDSGFHLLDTIHAPETDAWTTLSTDLFTDGLSLGDTFYFRAVDTDSEAHYAWLAMDNLQLSSAAPEPGTWSMLALSLAGIAFAARKRRAA